MREKRGPLMADLLTFLCASNAGLQRFWKFVHVIERPAAANHVEVCDFGPRVTLFLTNPDAL